MLTPSQLTTLLAAAIPNRRPILVQGAPGVGKTSIVKAAARRAGAHLIISHPAIEDPTVPGGLPWMENGVADFRPIGQTAKVLAATEPTVWFLDDLGQATGAVQAAYMPWLLERECNGKRLPDCVTIIAATNRRTDRANVSGVLEPVKSRWTTIVQLTDKGEELIADWSAWAVDQPHMPAGLIAFLRFRPDLLCAFEPSADLTNSPTPRTWEHAGEVLTMRLPADVESQAMIGAVGSKAAGECLAFLRMMADLPSVDAILLNPDTALIPDKPSSRYAVVTALATRANPRTFGRIARYAQRLHAAQHGEFAALLVRDCARRDPAITTTADFIRLQTGEMGNLFSGAAA